MQERQPSLFGRDDTFLGACEAVGEDFGFNPLYLRLALGVALLWNPLAVGGVYLALAAIVLASRLIAPDPSRSSHSLQPAAPKRPTAANEATPAPEAIAA